MDTDESSSPISNDSSKKSSSRSSRRKSSTAVENGPSLLSNGDANHAPKIKKKKKKRRSSVEGGEADNINGGASDVETTAVDGTTAVKKVKKKKSKKSEKRRSSSVEGWSSDINNNGDGGTISKSSSVNSLINEVDFASSSSSSVNVAAAGGNKMEGDKLRDSLTLSKEPKKMGISSGGGGKSTMDNDDDRPSTPSRKSLVQFTASTLQRDSTKYLNEVMGEDVSSAASSAGGGGGDATSIKSTGSASTHNSSGGSALKKDSKYSGGGGGKKKAMFHDDETKDDAEQPTRGKFNLRPSFKLNDDPTSPPKEEPPPRRKSRKEMFARAANNSSLNNPNNNNDDNNNNNNKAKFKDTRRGSAPPEFQRPQDSLLSDDDNNEEHHPSPPPKRSSSMNELHQRPAISRRQSLKSLMLIEPDKDNDADNDGEDENNVTSSSRSRLKRTKTAIQGLRHHKELRRVRMSMEKQIYIPPKNRNRGIFSALGKLLAGRVVEVVLWTYQAGFGKVMLFFLTFYVVNIFFWAAIMDAVDRSTGGRCVHDESFDASSFTSLERYEFMFELAWTTFTTVGYGAIGPAPDIPRCYPIRLVCAFVAFTGVLFGSTTAAIMYSKLMRLLAKAHVTFSSTLCVQFGKGNESSTVRFGQFNFRASVAPAVAMKSISMEDLLDDSHSDRDGDKQEDQRNTSDEGFPVIEFRMVNDRANQEGSEIWDAQIRGIIQLNKDINPSNNPNAKATGGESTLDLDKKAYYQFALTPDSHPHFSRIWYARHVLNAESPLLKREIRDMIVQDGGKWDKDFNTASEIRQCLNEFISLRITLSGTSAVSANTVFAEHVYEYEDVVVGWRFANMVYEKTPRSRLWKRLFRFGRGSRKTEVKKSETYTKVDIALIHDIVPQPGDDYEDLAETSSFGQLGGLFKRA